MNTQDILQWALIGAVTGCWAWIFVFKLIDQDGPLYWWPRCVDVAFCWLPDRLFEIVTNALYRCEVCLAGQMALWTSFIIGIDWYALVYIPVSSIFVMILNRYI
jgi:hypothetical protein